MARIATLLFVVSYGSCMQMRETVERTVMVRTTGSDLQPAATGYIYKKKSDGPASVIKMGETEVIEHLSKFYGKPEAYKAPVPVPAGPFYEKEEDDHKAAAYTNEEVKPVVEHSGHEGDHIDGIADEDYDKMFEEYAKQLRDDKPDYGDFSHGLGHFDHDIYHGGRFGYDAKDDNADKYHGYNGKNYGGYGGHHYNKDDGDYKRQKHEGYSVLKEEGHKDGYDSDDHSKDHGRGYKKDDHGYKSGDIKIEGHDGFHKVYDYKEYKNGNFHDGRAKDDGHNKHSDGHRHHGSASEGYKEKDSQDSRHDEDGFGKRLEDGVEQGSGHVDHHSYPFEKEGESVQQNDGDFGAKKRQYNSKSFVYEVKH